MLVLRFLLCLALVAASGTSCPEIHPGAEGECVPSVAGAGEQQDLEDESLLALHHARSRSGSHADAEMVEKGVGHPAASPPPPPPPEVRPGVQQPSLHTPQSAGVEAHPQAQQPGMEAGHPAAPGMIQAQENHSWPGHNSPSGGHPGGSYPDYPGYDQGQPGGSPGSSPWWGGSQAYYPGYTSGSGPGYQQGQGGGGYGSAPWQSGGYEGYYPGGQAGAGGGAWQPGPGGGGQGQYAGGGGGGQGGYDPGAGYTDPGYYPQQHVCDGGFTGTVTRRRRMGKMCSCRRRQSSEGVQQATDGSDYGWACKGEEMVAAKLQYTGDYGGAGHFGRPRACLANSACSRFTGDCCPTEDDVMLECCEM